MNHKEEFQKLVGILRIKLRELGRPSRMQDIADELGYTRTYFSTLTGESGKVYENHVRDLRRAFPLLNDEVQSATISEPIEETYGTKQHPDHVKYVRHLEESIEFIKGILLSNLGNMSAGQQHLRALAIAQLRQMAKLRAREEGKTVAKVMDEINKEVADAALSIEQKDILSGIQGTGA